MKVANRTDLQDNGSQKQESTINPVSRRPRLSVFVKLAAGEDHPKQRPAVQLDSPPAPPASITERRTAIPKLTISTSLPSEQHPLSDLLRKYMPVIKDLAECGSTHALQRIVTSAVVSETDPKGKIEDDQQPLSHSPTSVALLSSHCFL